MQLTGLRGGDMILIMYGTSSVMVVVGLKSDRSMGGRRPFSEVPISSFAVLATYAYCQLQTSGP
jgi:hypothetical protein